MTPDLSALSDLFSTMQREAGDLYGVMTGVAAALLLGSLMVRVSQADSNPTQLIRSIVGIGFIALSIHAFPDWINHVQEMAHGWVAELDANPSATHQRFSALIAGTSEGEEKPGIWDVLWSKEGGLGHAVLYAIVLLAANLATVVMWIFAFVQQFMVLLQTGLAPPFLAMFLINSLSSRAYGFLLNLIAILLAPLGWAVMHIVTEGLMGWAEANQVYTVVNGEVVVGAQTVFFVLLISVWIVLGTIGAPWLIWKLLNSGANVGGTLLASMGMAVGQGLAGGASAGATAAMVGGSGVSVAAAGAAGAGGGMLSGAAGGSSLLMPTLVGAGAGLAMPSSASGEGVNNKAREIANKENS
ncbi:MAG: hypothetical protein ACON4R_08895 [Akkermansiaceae bacterium]